MAVSLGLGLSQGTPNEQSRTTTVTARVIINYSGGSYNGNKPSGTLTVDGQTFNFSSNFNYAGVGQGPSTTGSGSTTACTKTVTVSYGTATTRTVSASASFASGTASGTVSASNSINLTAIPAYSGSGGGDSGGDSGGGSGGSGDPVNPGVNAPWQGNATIDGLGFTDRNMAGFTYADTWPSDGMLSYYEPVGVVRFKTPKFTGSSQSVDIYLSNTESTMYSSQFCLRYALCESDENYWMYIGAGDVVNDPTIIKQGSLTAEEWEAMPFTIETDDLVGEKYYYLIFWFANAQEIMCSASMAERKYHQIRVNYTDVPVVSTTIYGENGIQNTYEIMIDNGTGWDTYQAFIDSGTKFEPYT